MPVAMDVARFLILLSGREAECDPMTHMRLHKLLYYCQGWALAMRDEPLFPESVEAWQHGPVVPTVWSHFTDRGPAPLPGSEGNESGLNRNDLALIEAIWERYKQYSATGLRQLTHQEPPWLEARHGLDPDAPFRREITHESMRSFFATEYERSALPGLDLVTLRRARESFSRGTDVGLAEFIAELS